MKQTSPSPIPVFHLIESLTRSGAGRVAADVAHSIHGDEYCSIIGCLTEPGPLAKNLQSDGIEVLSFGKRPGFDPGLVFRLARAIRRIRPAILHAHMVNATLYARIASLLTKRPHILHHEHSTFTLTKPSRKILDRLLLPLTSKIIVVADSLRNDFIAAGYPETRVMTIPNGIDTQPFEHSLSKQDARAQLALPEHATVIAIVSALEPRKDHTTFLDAVFRLRKRIPENVPLIALIAGDGALRYPLETYAADQPNGVDIRFLGEMESVLPVLRAADVYVSSSVTEGTSIALLEAMAAGTPVVATAVGGTPATLDHGRAGRLSPPRAPEQLSETIASALHTPDETNTLVAAALQRIHDHYRLDIMAHRIQTLYSSLPGLLPPHSSFRTESADSP